DRPELGPLILNETLELVLEYAAGEETTDEVDSNTRIISRQNSGQRRRSLRDPLSSSEKESAERKKRAEEIGKAFNLLLNSLDPGFLWGYLGDRFQQLASETDNGTPIKIGQFAKTIEFCLKTVTLDAHGDVRVIHLPRLLLAILRSSCGKVDKFAQTDLAELLAVCQLLLEQIQQSAVAVEGAVGVALGGSAQDEGATSVSREQLSGSDDQKLIEACLNQYQTLVAQICLWYCTDRAESKTIVLCRMGELFKEFADFPLYCFSLDDGVPNSSSPLTGKAPPPPDWLAGLKRVTLDKSEVMSADCSSDFTARSMTLDVLVYICALSASVVEQHAAIKGRKMLSADTESAYGSDNGSIGATSVLLKPMIAERDLLRLEREGVFQKSAAMLWLKLDEEYSACHQTAARLLCLLHSKRPNEASSECEDLIVADLTNQNRDVSCVAANKFRTLWALSRSINDGGELQAGLPMKPFNRAVMVLLGVLTDQPKANPKIELKTVAYAWFLDCIKHADLQKILQVLSTLLLHQSTARVSVQYVTVSSQVDRSTLPSLPFGVRAVSMTTTGGRQSLHHVTQVW
uniref:Uncharacterized protein n=1 Tax=Plectus sambesii TaxID=2011161 RepID=A0A914XCZ3_9BILA